ncbi:hypothetical protein [Burkholderia ubonensis]|uniref:hypothetical protein n=1 Tax=Burkholderia ubonensis TaxID=101571 RepID=UPI000755F479|nr:hypothetical protein [Burkholderia ubonensis]KVO55309.1 hypothetical protein WJ77_14715 [Burkholderia ubonensis]KVR50027.1 hypothetical protein WK19_26010 [Burkholderia ubonensis]KVW22846.1 hypothetical protein WK94_02355 [Burkholderia ubonensis]KVX24388.1 hypothetical protein WL03_30465 [Burkholderia ubonensis]KVX42659.1 hypothetical protein WL04_03275 [Burkholderia ubonensis]
MAAIRCSVHGRDSGVHLTRTAAALLYGDRDEWAAASRLVELTLEDDGIEWRCFILESDGPTVVALGAVRDADGNYRIIGEDAAWAALDLMTATCHGCLMEMKQAQDDARSAGR